jgi:hypothetical protein
MSNRKLVKPSPDVVLADARGEEHKIPGRSVSGRELVVSLPRSRGQL